MEARQTDPARTTLRPRIDVHETDDALLLVADLPGATEQAVDLQLEEDVLRLRARPSLPDLEGWSPVRTEFFPAQLERNLQLTADIDRDAVRATFEQGRLEVTLPRKAPLTRRIEVSRA